MDAAFTHDDSAFEATLITLAGRFGRGWHRL